MDIDSFVLHKAKELFKENKQLKSSLVATKAEVKTLRDSLDMAGEARRLGKGDQ